MSAVVDKISEIQKAQVVPFPVQSPGRQEVADAAGVHDRRVCARTLNEFETPLKNDGQELLKSRFLCKGGGLLLVGPTGIGKSSLSMQMMISWALGKGLFGIEPARPITSLLIQAENDDGDLAEMRNGVFSGLNLTEEERELACSRIFVVQENARTSEDFFNETVRPMLEEITPDLLWIDPALSYLGGENNSQEAVGAFLRNQLNPLLTEFNCGAVVIHHTNKPYTGPEKRGPSDPAYLGSGSAEWANWSRAILTLRTTKQANVFELRAAKRGNRLGWREADGATTAYNRFIAHNKEPGTICWVDVVQDVAVALEKSSGRSPQDILKHVPLDRPIAKNTLIKTCADNGVGLNAARPLIDELVHGGELFVWTKPRQGTKPEVFLARVAQPVDSNGQKIFTEIITAILPHENAREDDTERSSHLHPPLGGVKIDREHREHREHQDRVASLSVAGTNAREDQPCEVILPKPPACLQNATIDLWRPTLPSLTATTPKRN
jgi:hypothetical protein